MFSSNKILLVLLVICIFGSVAIAETIRPGKYDCFGRVVKKANGEIAVFSGFGCQTFPAKLHKHLSPYLGKFVKVDYTRIRDQETGMITWFGSPIGNIEKVTVIANTIDQLPVVVTAVPVKKVYELSEPVKVRVSITNKSSEPRSIQLRASETVLCQDYRRRHALEPDDHYHDRTPYGLAKGPSYSRNLKPGQKIQFTVVSQQMAEPGIYQLLYCLSVSEPKLYCQSAITQVTVKKAENKNQEHKALKKWLGMATFSQRIRIAERLLGFGDNSGTEEILRHLKENQDSKRQSYNGATIRFVWRHGGQKGQEVMISLIKRQTRQDSVWGMLEGIEMSPNRIQLLQDLLACSKPTRRDIAGWVDEPRICDITARWLAGYTNERVKFPINGSLQGRGQAVGAVQKTLKDDPESFNVLSKNYW
ncbi:MAG: hypothetical protein K9M75_10990 [Phycisphaerae bacterium]|nr:hypothetical protein [Phycisphaerae bacterium]